jgi:adenylate cyclase
VFFASPAQFARRACAALRADRAYFFIQDPKTGDLTEQAGAAEGAAEFKIASGTGLIGWVALNREIVNLPEAHLDPRFDPFMDIQTDYRTRTLLAAPIVNSRNEVQGVLEVVNKHAGQFDADDEVLLQACAKQCAAALQSGA